MIIFILSAIVLVGLMAGLLIGEERVSTTVHAERQANYAFLGKSAAISEARAERWYRALFVKTKLTQFTFDIVGGTRVEAKDSPKIEGAAATATDWWRGRMRVMWSIAYQFLVRISNILIWLPLSLLVFLPFVVDAIVKRRIKATNFSLASPHMQLFGTKAMLLIAIGYFLLQMLPMMLHPIVAPLAIAAFSVCTWVGIANFAKRA